MAEEEENKNKNAILEILWKKQLLSHKLVSFTNSFNTDTVYQEDSVEWIPFVNVLTLNLTSNVNSNI